jgi:hypothetical protein
MTVFTPVQLISTQQRKLAAPFAVNPPRGVAVAACQQKSLSTVTLTFETTCETPAKAINTSERHLSADPPTAAKSLPPGAIPIPRIAWQ